MCVILQQLAGTRTGRIIGFEMGMYHSMTPITAGRRCVLLASFTVDPRQQELAHVQAETLLRGRDISRFNNSLHHSAPCTTGLLPGVRLHSQFHTDTSPSLDARVRIIVRVNTSLHVFQWQPFTLSNAISVRVRFSLIRVVFAHVLFLHNLCECYLFSQHIVKI